MRQFINRIIAWEKLLKIKRRVNYFSVKSSADAAYRDRTKKLSGCKGNTNLIAFCKMIVICFHSYGLITQYYIYGIKTTPE